MGEGMSENEIPEQLTELLIINARIRELNADHEWRVDWGNERQCRYYICYETRISKWCAFPTCGERIPGVEAAGAITKRIILDELNCGKVAGTGPGDDLKERK